MPTVHGIDVTPENVSQVIKLMMVYRDFQDAHKGLAEAKQALGIPLGAPFVYDYAGACVKYETPDESEVPGDGDPSTDPG